MNELLSLIIQPSEKDRYRRVLVLAGLLLVTTTYLPAASGSLVSVQFDQSYSVEQVDRMASRLFGNLPAPAARYAVDAYMIRYESLDLENRPTVITAQLFVPRYDEPAVRPVYIMAPGTTGLTDACRTSREHVAGVNWGLYRHHVLSHSGQGVITAVPDYMNFGIPDRLQPYFVAVAEGRVVLDTIRAIENYFARHDTPVRPAPGAFLAGFSQGGHASFAAADLKERYAPDVQIGGVIGYGPTTDIESLFRNFPVVAAPVIYTYAELYGEQNFDPAEILADRWLGTLEQDVLRLCILGLQSYYPWSPGPLFRPEFTRALQNRRLASEYPGIHRIMRMNSTGLSGHGIPALILQGSNDVVVDLDDQEAFVVALRARGSEVRYRILPDSPHDTRQIGFYEVLDWMQERINTTESD